MNAVLQQEQVVRLTETAASQIKELLAQEPEAQSKGFRVYIENGGCSGLSYGMTLDEQREGDHTAEIHGIRVLVDKVSADYVRGSTIDYSEALTGGGIQKFPIHAPKAVAAVENRSKPNQTSD